MRPRLLPLALLFLTALPVAARTRSVARVSEDARLMPVAGTIVSGAVTGVVGHIVSLADGLVTIDASNARISPPGQTIETGMMIVAMINATDAGANAPLPAASIVVTRMPDVALSGPVHSIDASRKTFTVLGRTIHVTDQTSFGGMARDNTTRGFEDILPNQLVHVQANAVHGTLVAESVQIVAPMPPPTHTFRGKVKSIGADQWVITSDRTGDLTIAVNAQTKIVGSPKVDDLVEVLASVDSSHGYVALVILRLSLDPPPSPEVRFEGVVKAISASEWKIAVGHMDREVSLAITPETKIVGSPQVGDKVQVIAVVDGTGFRAISITKPAR